MLSALFLSITAMAQTDVTTGVMRGKDYGAVSYTHLNRSNRFSFYGLIKKFNSNLNNIAL